MKTIKYFIACFVLMIVFANTTKAQGNNLQFNSAVHYTYTCAGDGNTTTDLLLTTTLVVPANKVLKIENAYASSTNPAGAAIVSGCYITLDNVWLNGPRSLPAGTYTVRISDIGSMSTQNPTNHYGFITGILYNIVP